MDKWLNSYWQCWTDNLAEEIVNIVHAKFVIDIFHCVFLSLLDNRQYSFPAFNYLPSYILSMLSHQLKSNLVKTQKQLKEEPITFFMNNCPWCNFDLLMLQTMKKLVRIILSWDAYYQNWRKGRGSAIPKWCLLSTLLSSSSFCCVAFFFLLAATLVNKLILILTARTNQPDISSRFWALRACQIRDKKEALGKINLPLLIANTKLKHIKQFSLWAHLKLN